MEQFNLEKTELTARFIPHIDEVKSIIRGRGDITLTVSSLRKFARVFIRNFIQDLVSTIDIDELNNITGSEDIKDNLFLKKLDGTLLRYESSRGELLISTACPFVNFFNTITEEAFLNEYIKVFKNEGVIHPFCIVHQVIREELLARISKGPLFTHPVLIGTRNMLTGSLSVSKNNLSFINISEEDFKKILNGYACAFLIL